MGARGYVYILTNKTRTVLYVGSTRNLPARIIEHRDRVYENSFTAQYRICVLVYYEKYEFLWEARIRERKLKGRSRKRKQELINSFNPNWDDLFDEVQGLT